MYGIIFKQENGAVNPLGELLFIEAAPAMFAASSILFAATMSHVSMLLFVPMAIYCLLGNSLQSSVLLDVAISRVYVL